MITVLLGLVAVVASCSGVDSSGLDDPESATTANSQSGTSLESDNTSEEADVVDDARGDDTPGDEEGGSPPARFETLPPGAELPDGATCAEWVGRVEENVPENARYNIVRGSSVVGETYIGFGGGLTANDFEGRIDGDFDGSTDEILQWGACKWGFDEDLVRAQAYTESSWYAGRLGDCGESTVLETGGEGGCASFGLFQVRGAELEGTFHPGTYPVARLSSAMNVDYALAIKRLCFEGFEEWLADFAFNPEGYVAGDEWGCMGRWFSGNFRDEAALEYISAIETNLAERNWESEFVGCPDWRENFYCSGLDLPVDE